MKEKYKNNIFTFFKSNKKYKNTIINLSNLLIIEKIILIFLISSKLIISKFKIRKIGVICLNHHQNIGNNLLKYAVFIKLSQLGFKPYLIGKQLYRSNITFLYQNTNIRIIKKFSEIKEKDYEILMVNSDQTWRKWNKDFYNIAFLKFAEKWKTHKFVYGTSLGLKKWKYSKNDEKIAKYLLKNFTGISVREKGSIKVIEKHLGLKPILVLDPTLLIDKKYYLKIIFNYKNDFNINDNYIFIYKVLNSEPMNKFIEKASIELNYKIYNVDRHKNDYVQKFLYGIYHCKAVITNSFHATLFSIIFNKPFISFKLSNDERLKSLNELFGFYGRIIEYDKTPNITLLKKPLIINRILLNSLKIISNNFLKKNLNYGR